MGGIQSESELDSSQLQESIVWGTGEKPIDGFALKAQFSKKESVRSLNPKSFYWGPVVSSHAQQATALGYEQQERSSLEDSH